METVVHTAGLCKYYRGKKAVDGLNMQVRKGEIYGFIGHNGSGKSTTFKMLAGLVKPTAGEIALFDRPLTDRVTTSRVSALIEDAGIYEHLSPRDNVRLKADWLGLADGDAATDDALRAVGLDPADKTRARRLSMGNRRRLGLALAIVGAPDLLLLDEPTNGLDPEGIRDVRALLLRLNQERGVTIVISSHLLGELEKIATCYGILRAGRMVRELTAAELQAECRDALELHTTDPKRAAVVLEQALHLTHYEVRPGGELRVWDPADPAAVTAALVNAGIPVQSVGAHYGDLEGFFLQLMGGEHDGK